MASSLLPPLVILAAVAMAPTPAHSQVDLAPGTHTRGTPKPVGYKAADCRYQLSGAQRTLICRGQVRLWRDDVSLMCDRLTARFSASGALESARCTGAVEIVTTGATAKADEAQFDGNHNQVQLSGRPRVFSKGNSLTGRNIRLDVASGEIFVDGAAGVVVPEQVQGLPGQGAAPGDPGTGSQP